MSAMNERHQEAVEAVDRAIVTAMVAARDNGFGREEFEALVRQAIEAYGTLG